VELAKGVFVGRFMILDTLGAGGMAVVYRAYDPQLDRQVAIKVVRGERLGDDSSGSGGQKRLFREAQLLARVTHPNVVTVHEVGLVDQQVFIAQELMGGGTLGGWVRAERRPWPEVLRRFVLAGRGLAAAHDRGLVHRDFKPENVLLGSDGSVRVSDFGLARSADAAHVFVERDDGGSPAGALDETQPGPVLSGVDTELGARVGTPAYMAPEQHRGERADARSDQFSFCVSLYEALYGVSPFSGDTVAARVAAVLEGQLRPAPVSPVPARVRRALLRGLSVDPAARWPSLEPLLAALEVDPAAPRRRLVLGVLAAVVVAGAVGGGYLMRARAPVAEVSCGGGEEKLAGAWDDARRQAVRDAFTRAGRPPGDRALATVEAHLDGWTAGFTRQHREACERRTESSDMLDRRMACLDRRRQELAAVTELLGAADAQIAEKAVQTVANLTPATSCGDLQALRELATPGPEIAARVVAIRAEAARAKALQGAGKYAKALEIARLVLPEARAVDHPPALAELLYLVGTLEERTGALEAAEGTLTEAAFTAEAAHHTEIDARAGLQLVRLLGYSLSRFDAAHRWTLHVEAALERAGPNEPLAVEHERMLGVLANAEAKPAEGLTHLRRALALAERGEGATQITVASIHNSLGNALYGAGKLAPAEAEYRQSLASYEALLGEHPLLVSTLGNLANTLSDQGRLDEELVIRRRALAIAERVLPPEHSDVATAWNGLGNHHMRRAQYDEALRCHRRALAIWEKLNGPDHPDVATSRANLGSVLELLGDLDGAGAEYAHAERIWRKALGDRHPDVGVAIVGRASVLARRGRPRDAILLAREVLALWTGTLDKDHLLLVGPLLILGEAHLALGVPQGALEPLERAAHILEAEPGEAVERASVNFALARALVATGGDASRARSLAVKAKDALGSEPRGASLRLQVDTFLAR
jgi:eukaryotic-like serine/threonine-protein kinase